MPRSWPDRPLPTGRGRLCRSGEQKEPSDGAGVRGARAALRRHGVGPVTTWTSGQVEQGPPTEHNHVRCPLSLGSGLSRRGVRTSAGAPGVIER